MGICCIPPRIGNTNKAIMTNEKTAVNQENRSNLYFATSKQSLYTSIKTPVSAKVTNESSRSGAEPAEAAISVGVLMYWSGVASIRKPQCEYSSKSAASITDIMPSTEKVYHLILADVGKRFQSEPIKKSINGIALT